MEFSPDVEPRLCAPAGCHFIMTILDVFDHSPTTSIHIQSHVLILLTLTGEESIPRVCENNTTGITTLRLIHGRTDVFVSFFGLNHMMTE